MNENKPKLPDLKTENKEDVKIPLDLMTRAALVRTMLAAETSLMAWVRTSISLYAFGFSVITFFDYLSKQIEETRSMMVPMLLGFTLICVGIFSIIMAIIEHKRIRKRLQELGLPFISKISLPISSATALFIIGILSLIAIILHISV
jgi:putative membrane protein